MEDKKLLNDESLEIVTGGDTTEDEVKLAFRIAMGELHGLAGMAENGMGINDGSILNQMHDRCLMFFITGGDVSSAISDIERLCNTLIKCQMEARVIVDKLKTAVNY